MSIIFDPGDLVQLREPLGRLLPEGLVGTIIRVYPPMPHFTSRSGALSVTQPRYGVYFPSLRKTCPPPAGPWYPPGIHPDGITAADIVPVATEELEYLGTPGQGGA
jgi:hypothetical protein